MRDAHRTTRNVAIFAALMFLLVTGGSLRAQAPAGAATLDQILAELSSYDGGVESAPFWKLRDYIYARKDNAPARAECEGKLLEFLSSKATPVAKMAVCRHLRVIGSVKSVPVLQGFLLDESMADMALYALQKIPASAVNKALLQTLSKAEGPRKISIIAALGDRKCTDAVTPLLSLLKSGNEIAGAAALALGEIGSDTAANGLLASLPTATPDVKPIIAASLMKLAENQLAANRGSTASTIYGRILADNSLAAPIRQAGMIGKISAAGDGAAGMVIEQLKGTDLSMQEAAISKIREVFKPEGIGTVCSLLPGMPENSQVKLIAVLSTYPRERVLPTVLQAARSNSEPVRIAAFKALETVGDASAVPFLVETAARTRGAEQSAARGALGLIHGAPADVAVVALLAKKPAEDQQVELLQAVAERRIYSAKNTVTDSLASTMPRVRLQALRALRTVGTPSDMPAVLSFLVRSDDISEQSEGAATVTALAQKISNPNGRSNAVKDMLARTKDPGARIKLFGMLGRIGDDSSLPILRAALADPNEEVVDAAVRTLAAWPNSASRDDVIQLAQKARNETHRLLALQGFVRMIRADRYRKPEAAVADLRLAYVISSRPEERRLILAALPSFSCPEALELAGILLGDPAVKAEAQAAINKMKK